MIKSMINKSRSLISGICASDVLPGLALLLAFTFLSCAGDRDKINNIKNNEAGSGEKSITDYSGIYKPADLEVCNLVIIIKKNNGGYIYSINGAGIKSTGRLSLESDSDQVYLKFNGTLRSGDNTSVEGLYSDRKITIQNYGNSINQYVCFKKCDVKFIELLKAD